MAGANPQMLIRIAANLQKLKENLAEGKAQIEVTTAGMQKMAASLDGSKLEQRANNITAAINEVGGASKLTDAEARRLLPTLDAWIEKGQRMGKEIPPDILKTRDALKDIDDTAKRSVSSGIDLIGTLTKIGGAVGIAFSVGAIKSFVVSVFDSASQIGDLSSQLGISTDAVQGFQFAAEQSGSSLAAVGTALTKMNANLADGDKSTVKALKDAGLAFDAIRSMSPEDAFLTITDAIQKIPDPMIQTDVALKLFGKSAAELLPAIKDGFRGVSDGAAKMSTETIKSLKAAQDAWSELGRNVTIVTGNLIAAAMDLGKAVTASGSSFAAFARDAVLFGGGAAASLAVAKTSATQVKDIYLATAPAVGKTKEEIDAAAAASKRWGDQLEAAFRKWSGKDLAEQMKILDITFRRMADSGQITAQQVNAMAAEAAKLSEQGAKLTPRLWAIVEATGQFDPVMSKAVLNMRDFGASVEMAIPEIFKFVQASQDLDAKVKIGSEGLGNLGLKVGTGFEAAAKATKAEVDRLGELAQAFAQLAQIADGALGAIVRQFGTIISAIDTADKGIGSFKAGLSAFKKGDALSGILEMTTGIMGMASAAIAAGKAIAGLFNRSKGRDLVEDFAASMGGFDALREQLNALGEEGERLWIALTQGVGRNNPKEAQAAIDAIIKALAKKQAASEASTVSTEAEAQATIETAAAATAALEDVSARLLTNRDDWKAWSEDVTGFLQKLADDIRGMPIPSPTSIPGGSSSGGGGSSSRRSGGGSTSGRTSQAAASITVVSKLDGRVVARNQVRYIPVELMKAGR